MENGALTKTEIKDRIKRYCWECMGGQGLDCQQKDCPLYPLRPKKIRNIGRKNEEV